MQPPGKGERKFTLFDPGHTTEIAAMPIYGKNLKKNLLLQNHWADGLETWYVAFGEFFKVSINNEPGLTLTYFMARSNLVP